MTRTVSVYGSGQLGGAVADLLRDNPRYVVSGPHARSERRRALEAAADVVIIATTTRLADVAADIELAVRSGSNVLVSAEEAAYPVQVDAEAARRIDRLATERGVTVAGVGVNPGWLFDALVLTLLGPAPRGCTITVSRTVDISGFGGTVLGRIGVGHRPDQFDVAVEAGRILGHAGFPQSMAVVASALGLEIERIEKHLGAVYSEVAIDLDSGISIAAGESAGVDQTYTAHVDGRVWFTCHFFGHVALDRVGRSPADRIELTHDGHPHVTLRLDPGVHAQVGSQNMIANSVERILSARSGWVTVAELAPAFPAPVGA